MADDQTGVTPEAQTPVDTPPAPEGFKSEESKQALLSDLHKEREERKALQQEVAALKDSFSVVDQLRKALTTPDAPAPEDPAALAAQVVDMRAQLGSVTQTSERFSQALDIAEEIGITNVGDLKLIAAQQDEGAMKALAARLKGVTPGPTPKPDPSAALSGDPKPTSLADAISQHYHTQK